MSKQSLPVAYSREEMYKSFLSGTSTYTLETLPYPITRKEVYLASLCGMENVQPLEPLTREELYLKHLNENNIGTNIIKVTNYVPAPPSKSVLHTATTLNSGSITSGTYTPPEKPSPVMHSTSVLATTTVLTGTYTPPPTT